MMLPLAAGSGVFVVAVLVLAPAVAPLVGPPPLVLPTVPMARLGLVLEDGQGAVQLLGVVDVERAVTGLAKGACLVFQGLFAIVLVNFVVVIKCRLRAGEEEERGYQEAARGGRELHGARVQRRAVVAVLLVVV